MQRWFKKLSRYFVRLILALLVAFIVIIPITYGLIQTNWFKSWLANRIETTYNARVHSTLHIGSIEGRLPSRFILNDVAVVYDNPDTRILSDTLAHIQSVEMSLRVWDLLYGKIQLTSLVIDSPNIHIGIMADSSLTIQKALESQLAPGVPSPTYLPGNIDFYAPSIILKNGRIRIDEDVIVQKGWHPQIPTLIDSLQVALFVEINQDQRFIDLTQLKFNLPYEMTPYMAIQGQLFSDERFTEANDLTISTERSNITLNMIVEGFDINQKRWVERIDSATANLKLSDTSIDPTEIAPWINGFPILNGLISVELEADGNLQSVDIRDLRLGHSETIVDLDGTLNNFRQVSTLSYTADIRDIKVGYDDLRAIIPDTDTTLVRVISDVNLSGNVNGRIDSIYVDADIMSPAGNIAINGGLSFDDQKSYEFQLAGSELDFTQWQNAHLGNTYLNISARAEGASFDRTARMVSTVSLNNSRIFGYDADTVRLASTLQQGVFRPRITASSAAGWIQASGTVTPFNQLPEYAFDGNFERFNLTGFTGDTLLPETNLNAGFTISVFGRSIDELYGQVSIDSDISTIAGDTLEPIQAYADLSEPSTDNRSLRVTSSVLDALLTGSLRPRNIIDYGKYWSEFIVHQYRSEFVHQYVESNFSPRIAEPGSTLNLDYTVNVKDVDIINKLIPQFPRVYTKASISGSVRADAERMLLDVTILDDSTRYQSYSTSGLDLRLTMALQYGSTIGETGNIQYRSEIDSLRIGSIQLGGVSTRASMMTDTIRVDQTISQMGESARASFSLYASLKDSLIDVHFPAFFLGNNQYSWRADGDPHIRLLPERRIEFTEFSFVNGDQRVEISGELSELPTDQLQLNLIDVDMERISELIAGRLQFGGIINGSLSTRSLRTQTNLEGLLEIDEFVINDRIVGDLVLDSSYNPEMRWFDTNVKIQTDSLKYAEYFERNNGIGQDIEISGYLAPKNINPNAENLFNFDLDLREVDLWIIRFLLTDVFTQIEGKASGTGTIKGNTDKFVYDSNFVIEDAQVVPIFLNTNYTLNGDIQFNDVDGLVLDNIRVNDNNRGTGVLNGRVDMNDFKPEKYLDIRLRLNRLEFLNNSYGEDVPFYGRVSGSGEIRLSGPNTRPFLQTTRPITVTPNSKLIIPLLDDLAINQQTNFIRFVNEFFELNIEEDTGNGQSNNVGERSFTDIFQLDLQFNMPQDAAIEFIFDPVTNEYLTTRGTGSVRITLESGNLGMFGTFDIDRGEYNFVGGDIFSKKFKIRQGGVVTWDGLAQDPRIQVTAYYSARPNLEPLGTGRNMRVPIDLILNLNGRMGSLENDFYFAYPTNFDAGLTASELNILNGEDQKLLQATSLLITGNFLPVNQAGSEADINLQNRVTQAGIGSLLSSQINYLLNSSLSNFDFDLNLTGFDQADLGIGLRLFDDRLELRRDGTIVGEQTNIGDLAATYRINQFFSIEIFHRQDINSSRGVTQEGTIDRVNGVGVQYQVQFSTWKKFLSDIWNAIKGIGG